MLTDKLPTCQHFDANITYILMYPNLTYITNLTFYLDTYLTPAVGTLPLWGAVRTGSKKVDNVNIEM
jgi:hypothetical protein